MRDPLDRRCYESAVEDYESHYDAIYASWLRHTRLMTANVIEGEEFDTDSDPGDEA